MKKEVIKPGISVEALKQKYGNIFRYTTSDGKVAYFKSPNLTILDYCKTVSNGSNVKFNKLLAENCFVEGDKEIITEEKYLLGLFEFLPSIIDFVTGELVRL